MKTLISLTWRSVRFIAGTLGTAGRATVALVGLGVLFAAAANYTMTQGVGTTFASAVISGANYVQFLICDATAGATQCGAVKAGNTAATTDVAQVVADPNAVAAINQGVGTPGSAPPANVIYLGANASGATGGLIQGIKQCDQSAFYDASSSGSTQLVPGVASRKIYVCGYILGTGTTATKLSLVEGTTVTTPCDTGTVSDTPAWQLAANAQMGLNGPHWNGFATQTAGKNLCVNASAANAAQAQVLYTIQ